MKIESKLNKIYAGAIAIMMITIVFSSVFAVRTITDSSDSIYTSIVTSAGGVYPATFSNLITVCAIPNIKIQLPSCNISITDTFPISSGITLSGCGNSTIFYFATGTNKDMITINSKDVIIENIKMQFNGAGQTSTTNLSIIRLGTCNNILIQRCSFWNGHGNLIEDTFNKVSKNVTIVDCDFHGREARYWGGAIHTWNKDWIIKNNFIENTYACGIVIESGTTYPTAGTTIIDGNRITGNIGTGIYMEHLGGQTYSKGGKCVIVNNIITHLTGIAYGATTAIGILLSENSTCSNNIISYIDHIGISVNGNNSIISNNIITKITGISSYGILLSGTGTLKTVTIDGNSITTVNGIGIYGGASWTHSVITDNKIRNCTSIGIRSFVSESIISNNFLYNVSAGITTDSTSYNSITGNHIENLKNTDGIKVYLVSNSTIIGNVINSIITYDGIEIADSKNITVASNIIRAANGVRETGISNYNLIVDNNVMSCTAKITRTGAKSIISSNLGFFTFQYPTTVPTDLVAGSCYVNTTTGDIAVYSGAAWIWTHG